MTNKGLIQLKAMNGVATSPVYQSSQPQTLREFWCTGKEHYPHTYWARVERYLSWLGSKTPGADTVKEWLDHLVTRGASAAYVVGNFYACKVALLAWTDALSQDLPRREADLLCWCLERQLKHIKLPTVVRGKRARMIREFKPEAMDRVIRSASPRIGLMIEFLADTGMRVSEMTGLRLKDIKRFDKNFSFVSIVGKGNKERAVFIQNRLLEHVQEVFQGIVFLFETQSRHPLNPDNVYKEIKRTFYRIEGVALTPHNLRHYFATQQLGAGASARAVADYLGHSTPATTLVSYDVSVLPLTRLVTQHREDALPKKKQKEKPCQRK